MYVEVELRGRPVSDRFVIPRSTVHDKKVYISTPENRLEIRSVEVESYMENLAVLSHGLKEGETLVLSDLIPAVEGMLLKSVEAVDILKDLKHQALGEAR